MKLAVRRSHLRQGFFFLIVGGISAVIDAGVFWLLVTWGIWPTLASVISFCAAFAVNYRGNRDLVFRAQTSHRALGRYTVLVVINLGLSAGGVALGTEALHLRPIVAKIATMIVVALINFIVMRLWVFRERSKPNSVSAPLSE